MATVYVAGDVRGIQGYVFGSPRLLEMRGASALIDFFDRKAVPALIEGDEVRGETTYSGGGNFLAKLEGERAEERAAVLVDQARHAFLDLVGTVGLTVVSLRTDKDFDDAYREMTAKMRDAKRSPSGVEALASMPFLKRCESCGREAADRGVRRPGGPAGAEPQWVGPSCWRKREIHSELQKARNEPKHGEARWSVFGVPRELPVPHVTDHLRKAKLPRDFQELTGEDDLAVVVADGNGLGDWLRGRDEDGFKTLSEKIDKTLRGSLDAATRAAFSDTTELTLQVLICGGDDLVVALPARRALKFVRELLASFRVVDPQDPEHSAGISAGLVFCRTGFPFRRAHDLAGELVGRAKHRCRRDGLESAVDLHRILGSHVQSLDRERQSVERSGKTHGWSYGAAGPYSPQELDTLLDLARTLRTETSATQRGRLREILSPRDDRPESPLDCVWKVPRRVMNELRHWLGRQEEPPFELPEDRISEVLLSEDRVEGADGLGRTMRRWKLSDALMLAEYVEV
jgi:hypothetical protein